MRESEDNVVIISSCGGGGKVVFYSANGSALLRTLNVLADVK